MIDWRETLEKQAKKESIAHERPQKRTKRLAEPI
jgi:hypothetical protein